VQRGDDVALSITMCLPLGVLLSLLCMAGALHINECSPWKDGREICIDAWLYQDGTIAAQITNKSTQYFWGCKGGVVLIGSDESGYALWQVRLDGRTAGGFFDPFCQSFQRLATTATVNGDAARKTTSVRVLYDFTELSLRRRYPEVGPCLPQVFIQD